MGIKSVSQCSAGTQCGAELETLGGGWGGRGLGSVCGGRVRRFTCRLCVPSPALSCNENDAEHLDRDQPYPSSQKTKRMRTSFKHHQLRTMKSYFAINHNPDAKDLKQLAQKTGLTKRVLQVSWDQVGRGGICIRPDLGRKSSAGCRPWEDLLPCARLSLCLRLPFFFHLFRLSLFVVFQSFFFPPSFTSSLSFNFFLFCVWYPSLSPHSVSFLSGKQFLVAIYSSDTQIRSYCKRFKHLR